jgi:hypothetical protein
MYRSLVLAAAGAALVACAASLWPTKKVTATAPADDAFGCAVSQGLGLRYKITRVDSSERQVDFRRTDKVTQSPDLDEYSRWDVLSVRAQSQGPDTLTHSILLVQAGTASEHMTRRGPTEVDEYASPHAKADADSIISRCAISPQGTAPANSLPAGAP